jgi:hypothetical protein
MTLDDELAELGVTVPAPKPTPPAPSAPEKAPERALSVVAPGAVHPMAVQWAKWRERIAEAMDLAFDTMEGLEQMVLQGRLQFWPGREAAVITEIYTYAGGEKVIQAKWAAGDVAEILEMVPGIEAFGRMHGCTTALVEGREGWVRPLKPLGYSRWSVTLRKALT